MLHLLSRLLRSSPFGTELQRFSWARRGIPALSTFGRSDASSQKWLLSVLSSKEILRLINSLEYLGKAAFRFEWSSESA